MTAVILTPAVNIASRYGMIDASKPFSLYANCEVIYDGRAYSILESGNYLIIYKDDGSIQIHGANKIQPRNYQGAKSALEVDNNHIISRNKKETITININEIIDLTYLDDWSMSEVNICKTEQELVHKLFTNWDNYIDGEFQVIQKEFPTKYGPIDIAGYDSDGILHMVECKRGKVTIANCTQLLRYIEAMGHDNVVGYIAAPTIGDNAKKYLEEHGCRWISIDFD